MTIEKGFVDWKSARVHYHCFGTGPRLLIALHGFGDRAALFDKLEHPLGTTHRVFAIDLPFHGQTQWPYKRFDRTDLLGIIHQIMALEKKERLELLGYSLGGRLVQSLLSDLENCLDQLYLLAPDGLRTKGMFNATFTPVFIRRKLSQLLNAHPEWFSKNINRLYRYRLISRFIRDFCLFHISSEDRRRRVLGCWLSLDAFELRPATVKKHLIRLGIPVWLYFGRRDEVIPLKSGIWLADKAPNIQLYIMDEGHLVVNEELQAQLSIQLSQQTF
ncbi:MAG: alpha/beta hydrolase [Bacteroidota bacterium]